MTRTSVGNTFTICTQNIRNGAVIGFFNGYPPKVASCAIHFNNERNLAKFYFNA